MDDRKVIYMLVPVLLFVYCTNVVTAPPPPKRRNPATEAPQVVLDESQDQRTGLHYDEYLQTVVKLLESDENFRKTMEQADFEDIKSGKLSGELLKIPSHIREKLDSTKKDEILRLRKILRAKADSDKGRRIPHSGKLKEIADHLDSSNVHTFEAPDLTNLIKAATKDLENFDEKRHQDFKQYEMMKQMRRTERLNNLTGEARKEAEAEYEAMQKKHDNHAKVNHPGSKAQLDEVWRETDGLVDEKFDPKTFFIMHDINGDNALDPIELEALFETELRKVYDKNNPEDDMVEMEEERRRMREHVTKEVDKNGDGVVSMEEFLKYTNLPEFEHPDEDSYKTVDDLIEEHEVYTDDELNEFRDMVKTHEDDLKEKLDNLNKKVESVTKLKNELAEHEKVIGPNPEQHAKEFLDSRKKEIQEHEQAIQEIKEDVDEHREELAEMKEELKQQEDAIKGQEAGAKLVDNQGEGDVIHEDLNAANQGHEPLSMQKNVVEASKAE